MMNYLEMICKFGGMVGAAVPAVLGTAKWFREKRSGPKRGQASIRVGNDGTTRGDKSCEAILHYMSSLEHPHAPRWGCVREICVGKGLATALAPCGPDAVHVPGVPGDVSVRVGEMTVKDYLVGHENGEIQRRKDRSLELVVFANSIGLARRFIDESMKAYEAALAAAELSSVLLGKPEPKYMVYKGEDTFRSLSPPVETFDTLHVPQRSKITDIVVKFEGSAEADARDGIKHQLSMMLSGPPGGGKTCMAAAIAKKMGRSLIVIPLSLVSSFRELEDLLNTIFVSEVLPSQAVVVFDDCDTWEPFKTSKRDLRPGHHSESSSESSSSAASSTCRFPSTENESVAYMERMKKESQDNDLSIILNLIDGNSYRDGQVFVFTTNRIECFDDAFLREGRMNCIEMGPLDVDCVQRYFDQFFPDAGPIPEAVLESVRASPPMLGRLSELLRTRNRDTVCAGLAKQRYIQGPPRQLTC